MLALFAAVLAPAASAQSRSIGTVVIANGWSSADSAVASALAALESDSLSDAVVLYARKIELTTRTSNFIRDRQPSEAILVGGTEALSSEVYAEVVALVGSDAVRRIEGANRFDTAAKAVPSNATTFIVANGYSAADTGVAAALAATRSNAAVLLARTDRLTEPTERIIREQQPTAVEFVGGTKVLSAALEDRVRELAPSVSSVPRHSGAGRTETAADAASSLSTTLVIANGWSPADMGVAAAYSAITTGAAVLYSQTRALTTPTENRISALQPRSIVLVGGNAALDTSLHARLRALAPSATLHRISGTDRIDTAVRAAAGTLTAVGTEPPGAPTSLTATPRNSGLAVSWRVPTSADGAAVTGYVVEYRVCTASLRTCASSPSWGSYTAHAHTGTANSTTITGLANGTAYQVRVRARNSFGLGSWSSTVSGIPAAQSAQPSVPAGLTVEAANEQLKVSWSPSAPPSGGSVDGYQVQYRTCGASLTCGNWTSHSHTGTGTTTTITGLSNGTKYEVRVQATSSRGDSGWSSTASATPALLPSFELEPDLTAGDHQLLVKWNLPGYSGSAIRDYDVQYRQCTATNGDKTVLTCADDNNKPTWSTWRARSHSGTAQTTTITGLTNGTAYQVQVRATNANGVGPWSKAGKETPVSVPDRTTGVRVEPGKDQLVVTWNEPVNNGSAIDEYDVERCESNCTNDASWTDTSHSGNTTRHTITGLTNGTAYKVRVRARNDIAPEFGPWSSTVSGTPRALPDPPSAPGVSAGDRQITVMWTAPGSLNGTTITGYDIGYRRCTATPKDCTSSPKWSSWSTKRHTDLTSLSATLTSLTNATKYQVSVRARAKINSSNVVGPYSAAASITPLGKPAKPATPTLTVGDATLVVAWKAPAANGSAITHYDVARCASTTNCSLDSNWTEVEVSGTPPPTQHTINSGLSNGVTYRVRVRAANSQGDGPWSSYASGTPSLRPDAPAEPSVQPSNGKIGLTWQEPSGNGLAITQYYVGYRACTATDGNTTVLSCSTNPTWGNWVELSYGAATTAATITGLTNGTKYEVRVRARTANGLGPWSPVASKTPLAAPSTPTGLTVEPSNAQMVVSWTEPASHGSTISGYIVEYRACTAVRKDCTSSPKWNPTWTKNSDEGTDTSRTITGLTNGTAYQVQVRAKSETGNSGWTPIKSAIVAAVPDAPDAPVLTRQNRQIYVVWQEPTDHNSRISRYEVGYRPCTGTNTDPTLLTCASNPAWGSWRLHGDTSPNLSRIITGLTNGTAYQVRVRAQNEKGWGPWSPSTAATPVGSPAAPTAPTVTTGDGQLTVDWIIPRSNGSNITGYDVRYRNCMKTNADVKVLTCASNPEWGTWTPQAVSGKDTTTSTVDGRTNGTAVQVRIRAKSDQGDSPWSAPAEGMPRGKPDAPEMTVTSGNQRLVVTWPTPNAKGSTVTGFKLRWCDDTDSQTDCNSYDDWTTRSLGSSTRTSTISSLTNGNSHKLEMLTTSKSHGESVWTTESTTATPGAPNAPSTPSLTAGPNSGEITVTWSLPAKNHSDITQYQVAYCNNTDGDCASGTWTTQDKSTDLTNRRLTLSSLTTGKSYKVRVRAENTQGWGAWSSTRTATPKA